MNKKAIAFLVVIAMLMLSLSGCSKLGRAIGRAIRENRESREESTEFDVGIVQSSEDGTEPLLQKEEEEEEPQRKYESSEEAYRAFFQGLETVSVVFENAEDYYDEVSFGKTFDYFGLKQAVMQMQCCSVEPITEYAIVDLRNDGTEELILCFASQDTTSLNWTGIIRDGENGLELTYFYGDGYRIEATLFENGVLRIGGSGGAGYHAMDYLLFDENSVPTLQYSSIKTYGSWAMSLAYSLNTDGTGLPDEERFYDMTESEMEICAYVPGKRDGTGVKFHADRLNDNPDIRVLEADLIEELEVMGAILTSEEELSSLFNQLDTSGPVVSFTELAE